MSKLLYNGVLSEQMISWIKNLIDRDNYQHWVEVSRYPKGFDAEWMDKNLMLYDSMGESCMGESLWFKTHKYCTVYNFIGFVSKEEKNRFIESFSDNIANTNPFSVAF